MSSCRFSRVKPVFLVHPVCLVYLVCLVFLVYLVGRNQLVEHNKPDQPDEPNQPSVFSLNPFSLTYSSLSPCCWGIATNCR
jgi:hypothetical protein